MQVLPRQWSTLTTLLAAPAKALLARAVSFASTAAIAVTLGGEALFPALGLRNPDFLKSLQASKLQTCAAAWFIGNTGASRCCNAIGHADFGVRSATKSDEHWRI